MKNESILIKLKCFASLKDFWSGEFLELQVSKGVSGLFVLSEAERIMLERCPQELNKIQLKEIFSESVLASEKRILKADDKVFENCELAILPPVCGG